MNPDLVLPLIAVPAEDPHTPSAFAPPAGSPPDEVAGADVEPGRQPRAVSGIRARVSANAGGAATRRTAGALSDATPDSMTLHTTEALLLFDGRPSDDDTGVGAIAGGRRFAAIMKSLWHIASADNPYADWLLIRVERLLEEVRAHVTRGTADCERMMDDVRRKGLALGVLGSRNPGTVHLGFRSPYGYAMAEAVLEFDHYVRLVKTLIHKGQLRDDEGRSAIRAAGRRFRALFQDPIRWERAMLNTGLRFLVRADFLADADEPAQRRVRTAVQLLGEIPVAVLACDELPAHTRQRALHADQSRQQLREWKAS